MRPSHASVACLSTAAPTATRKGSGGGAAYFTALIDDPEGRLAAAQRDIFAQMEGADFEPVPPERFHVTLAHVPDISDDDLDAVLADLKGLPAAFSVEVAECTLLDSVNGIPLVLRVNPNPALLRLTGDIVRAMDARRIAVSTYSRPESYVPHITLALDLLPRTILPGQLAAPFSVAIREFVVTRNDYEETKRLRLPSTVGERVLVTAGPPLQALPLASERVMERAALAPDLAGLVGAIERNTAAVLRALSVRPAPVRGPDVHIEAPPAPDVVVEGSTINVAPPVVNVAAPEVSVEPPVIQNNVTVEVEALADAIERQTQEVLASRSADDDRTGRMIAALQEQAEVLRAAVQRESMAEAMAPFAAALEKVSRALMSLATKPTTPAELHVDFPAYRVTKKVVRDPETHAIDEVVEIFEPE